MSNNNLTNKTLHGVKWTTTATIVTSIMQIGYIAVMSRLLPPASFGLIALAGVVLRFAGYFSGMGLGQAVIQKQDLLDSDIRASFTSSFALGLFFCIVICLAAPFATLIYDEPGLVPVLRVMALSFLITGLSSTAISLLRRNIRFKEIAIIEIISYVLGYLIVGITLAYLNYGVWALVFATLSQVTIAAIASYGIEKHSLVFIFGWRHYKQLFGYGSKISLISFAEFIGGNLDTMVIGKVLGSTMLGFYNRGYMLVNLPMYFFTTSFSKVLFPSFSKIQADTEKLKKVYLSSITIVSSIIMPACIGLIVAGREIVVVMLGKDWEASIPVLQISAIAVSLSLITMFAGIVCDATANLRLKVILTVVYIPVLMALFYLFMGYGLVGFAVAIAVGQIFRKIFYIILMKKILNASPGEILLAYWPGIINGVVVGLGIFAATQVLRTAEFPLLPTLVIQIVVGGLLLFFMIIIAPPKVLKAEIQNFLIKVNFSAEKRGFYNKLMLSYMNYLNKR